MRSRRPAPADPAVRARLAQVLPVAAPSGGWVPPEDDEVLAGAADDEVGDDAGSASPSGPVDVPGSGGDATSWSSRRAADVAAVPSTQDGDSGAGPSSPAGARTPRALLDARRLLPASPAAPPSRPPGWLLDPSARGVAALVLLALVAAAVTAVVVLRGRPQEVAAPAAPAVAVAGTPLPGSSPAPVVPTGEVVVAVAGTVVRPGLVRLPAGSRVDDAVRAAGGLAPGASPGLLNLARVLVDGELVLVGVEPPPGAAPAGAPTGAGLVDLNRATAADLQDLPGIGPVLAERVVQWRAENGPFRSVEQLREVPGIGEATFAALRSKVVV